MMKSSTLGRMTRNISPGYRIVQQLVCTRLNKKKEIIEIYALDFEICAHLCAHVMIRKS